jgi:Na+/H+ antiporter NhaD/arsenite permease-like protein
MLFAGAVLSNLIGTTGASMLLIRPFLRLNRGRLRPYHVVFFIFVVSNVGGALTPIGDPPLFLGFLRGVPFFWTVTHIWYVWLPTLLLILGVFYVLDRRNPAESVRERAAVLGDPDVEPGEYTDVPVVHTRRHVAVEGKRGFVWLGVVIACVFLDPNVVGWVPDLRELLHVPFGLREVLLLAVAFAAYRTARPEALRGNAFTFAPMAEVAWLFVGIFLTMPPALELIRVFASGNADALGATAFYFGTGVLSSFLDNAPTYLSFLAAAMGKFGLDVNAPADVAAFAAPHLGAAESWYYLQAISVAAVFWGAMTYIGNGPNFMVKAIAEEAGVACPSFVGYVARYSLPVLLPIYLLVWLVFFSGLVPLHAF